MALSLTRILLLLGFFAAKNLAINSIKKLPDCSDTDKDVGFILVSTLDGKITSIDANGNLLWDVDTDPGPLLTSNIHNVELTNNGEWVRIIPSLTGSLYKFNGKTIDAIPITADSLLKSSFLYSNDLVIAGGRDVRTYGILAKTGDVLYECTTAGCTNKTKLADDFDDIILLERSTTTVRAHEPRNGNERWNFSVGYHNIKIPPSNCINLDSAILSLNVSAILPKGILTAGKPGSSELSWKHNFPAPIVKIWKWDGRDLTPIDVFVQTKDTPMSLSPAIYLGMHEKQLYIHESVRMTKTLLYHNNQRNYAPTEVIESKSMTRIPWKPISAFELEDDNDDSTALSVLYNSPYINGNGYYLYTEVDIEKKNTILCNGNITKKFFQKYMSNERWYWKELLLITATAIIFKLCYDNGFRRRTEIAVTMIERELSNNSQPISDVTDRRSDSTSISEPAPYTSRYMKDFETVQCLGKGGYGIVFEAKQKIDECGYAVKRITLPEGKGSERVLREVKALAKLDHVNIVRYCTSWLESPPAGFKYEFNDLVNSNGSTITFDDSSELTAGGSNKPAPSTIININEDEILFENEKSLSDSFIFFENTGSNSTKCITNTTDSNSNETITSEITNISCSENINSERNITFLFIQMQLCKKESLKDWLTNERIRDPYDILNIYNQILNAVKYIHSQKLIHRDLKPSNIFFSLEGNIKVGDFGLVTPMKNTENDSGVSEILMQSHTKGAGTYFYMSPEQIEGKEYNYKVDIFSLGVIFFELFVPFSTEMERHETLTDLRKNKYPIWFSKKYPNELILLNKMLSEKPKVRPDATEVKNILRENNFIDNIREETHSSLPGHVFI